ncbi:MAG: cytochrome C oxidase subunit IV family protein [Bacteroidota bacterium]
MKALKRKPYRRNGAVWLALMVLLAATAGSALIPLGVWNSIANLVIAAAKALLVAVFFMHLKEAGVLVRLVAFIALFMLVLLFSLASTDYLTRQIFAAPWQDTHDLHPPLERTR